MNQLNVQNKQHLRNVYDIYVLLDNNRIKIENAEIWVAIKLKEGARNFDHYKVAYLNKYGEMIEEYIPQVSNKKDELSFQVTHLSYYAVYAWNGEQINNEEKPPKAVTKNSVATDDNSFDRDAHLAWFILSGIVICLVLRKKNVKKI